MHVCFIGLFLFYRDISFLCDAMTAQKKTTLLPPLTDRSSLGDAQVSCLSLVFDHTAKNQEQCSATAALRWWAVPPQQRQR